eukprot:scaffold4854_cov131-Isochrysis_galbana.AAC.5
MLAGVSPAPVSSPGSAPWLRSACASASEPERAAKCSGARPSEPSSFAGAPARQSSATKDSRSVLLVDGISTAARSASAVAGAAARSARTVSMCAPRTATRNAAELAVAAPDCNASSSAVTTSASPCAAAHCSASWLGCTFSASKRLTTGRNPFSAAAASGVRRAV